MKGESRALSSVRAIEASPSLKEMSCVNAPWVTNWMRQWGIIARGTSDGSSNSNSSRETLNSNWGFLRLNRGAQTKCVH